MTDADDGELDLCPALVRQVDRNCGNLAFMDGRVVVNEEGGRQTEQQEPQGAQDGKPNRKRHTGTRRETSIWLLPSC